jgi:CubicO group peptidase (beta-lactamase class C family)
MLEIHRLIVTLLAILALASRIGLAADARAPLEQALDPVFGNWNKPGSPGVAVMVVRERKVLYSRSFGLASLEYGLPITPQTTFNAGSIAKQFTATAILMLAAEGKLSIDDGIHRYVPELPEFGHRITLRQLLNHTSGLRDIWALTYLAGWMSADVRTQRQALRLLSRQKTLNFTPGTGFIYSNSGYILLAEVVARVSGQAFPAWMTEHIFMPLGMTDSYFYQDHTRVLTGNASSYNSLSRDKGFARDILNSGLVGSGNIVTTAADLAKWSAYLVSAEIGEEPLLSRLSEQATLPAGSQTGYGMGLFVGTHRGVPIVQHGGASAGYRSHLLIFTDDQLAIVILGNVNTVRANELATEVADIVLSDRKKTPSPGAVPSEGVPALAHTAFTGLYTFGTDLLLDVRQADGRLFFLFGGSTAREMFASGPYSFVTTEEGVSLTFEPGEDNTVSRVVLEAQGRKFQGLRAEPVALTARQLRAYEGTYFSEELEAFYHIVSDEGGLRVEQLRGIDVALTPISPDRFMESAPGGFTLRFKRRRSGRVGGFELSVERARHIEFDKR